MRRWLDRAGWLLAVGTIVTAASLLPGVLEQSALDWLKWLGVVGTLVGAPLVRLTSPLAASVVGFFANTVFVALLLGVVVHLVERRKRRAFARL